ncbi:MAG: hypothetical protein JWM11_4016 [Planctomycetaceae bacterium]|nr:hypothetical protein [Planctomycetaceae bacterium]
MRQFQRLLAVTGVLCVLVIASAAEPKATDGKVSGHVIVNGKPLAEGRVFFHLDGGQFVGSKVENGEFQVDRVKTGTRKVTVEGEGVPARFSFEDKSGLVVDVAAGKNSFDLELK